MNGIKRIKWSDIGAAIRWCLDSRICKVVVLLVVCGSCWFCGSVFLDIYNDRAADIIQQREKYYGISITGVGKGRSWVRREAIIHLHSVCKSSVFNKIYIDYFVSKEKKHSIKKACDTIKMIYESIPR